MIINGIEIDDCPNFIEHYRDDSHGIPIITNNYCKENDKFCANNENCLFKRFKTADGLANYYKVLNEKNESRIDKLNSAIVELVNVIKDLNNLSAQFDDYCAKQVQQITQNVLDQIQKG